MESIHWMPDDLDALPESTAVRLAFRDGTTLDVPPDSEDGVALRTVAAVLASRDS